MLEDNPKKPRRNTKESVFQQWHRKSKMSPSAPDLIQEAEPQAEPAPRPFSSEVQAQILLSVPVAIFESEKGRHFHSPFCPCEPMVLIYHNGAIILHSSLGDQK